MIIDLRNKGNYLISLDAFSSSDFQNKGSKLGNHLILCTKKVPDTPTGRQIFKNSYSVPLCQVWSVCMWHTCSVGERAGVSDQVGWWKVPTRTFKWGALLVQSPGQPHGRPGWSCWQCPLPPVCLTSLPTPFSLLVHVPYWIQPFLLLLFLPLPTVRPTWACPFWYLISLGPTSRCFDQKWYFKYLNRP